MSERIVFAAVAFSFLSSCTQPIPTNPHATDATHPAEVTQLLKLLPEIPVDGSLDEILDVLRLEEDWTDGSVSSTHCTMIWDIAPGYRFELSFDPVPRNKELTLVFAGAGFAAKNKPGFPPHEYHTVYPYRDRQGMVSN